MSAEVKKGEAKAYPTPLSWAVERAKQLKEAVIEITAGTLPELLQAESSTIKPTTQPRCACSSSVKNPLKNLDIYKD